MFAVAARMFEVAKIDAAARPRRVQSTCGSQVT
jgi:hypothetical protein